MARFFTVAALALALVPLLPLPTLAAPVVLAITEVAVNVQPSPLLNNPSSRNGTRFAPAPGQNGARARRTPSPGF
ncbi:hypothetical protein K438DRAFT_1954230 [Mycena galopus ATCC 62051]|nr:hypothetical protein K438DRAFT_1954230 [Mycena galopus ATCC 62051]